MKDPSTKFISAEAFEELFQNLIDEFGDDSGWGYNDPVALRDWIAERLSRRTKDPDGYYNLSRAQQLVYARLTGKLVRGANRHLDRVVEGLKYRSITRQEIDQQQRS